MVLPDSHQMFVSCATWDTTSFLSVFGYRPFTFFGCAFQHFPLTLSPHSVVPQPHKEFLPMVWPLPFSLAATHRITFLFSFPKGTKMFQFPSFASLTLFIHVRISCYQEGFPHSDIAGSKLFRQLADTSRSLTRPSSLLDT